MGRRAVTGLRSHSHSACCRDYPYSPQQRPLYGEFHRIADGAGAVTGRREVRSTVRP